MHVSRVAAGQQTVRHVQQQTEVSAVAAVDAVIRDLSTDGHSHTVAESGQLDHVDGGIRQRVSAHGSENHGSADAAHMRRPTETRAGTGLGNPSVRLPQAAGAVPGTQRGSDAPQQALEVGGDGSQHRHATPDAAPAIASLIAQLASALRTARPAGLTVGDATGAPPLPDTRCARRRHGVKFLTVTALPSAAQDKPSAAMISTRPDAGVSGTGRAQSQVPVDGEPHATSATKQSAAAAERLPAQVSLLSAARSVVEHAQDAAERRQSEGSQAAGVGQPSTVTPPHDDSVLRNGTPAAAAADHDERHSRPRPRHGAASRQPAADGRDPATPPAVPMRCAALATSDRKTCW